MKLKILNKQYKAVSLRVANILVPAIVDYEENNLSVSQVIEKYDLDKRIFLRWKKDWFSSDIVLYLNEKSKKEYLENIKNYPYLSNFFKKSEEN